MIYSFTDYYDNMVNLSFRTNPFSENPKHVWVICTFQGKWLFTQHKRRGIEFPGGKVEKGELPEDAAKREVMEETGATIKQLTYIGQYQVISKGKTIEKNVYFAVIDNLEKKESYFETLGPILMNVIPNNMRHCTKFSFMMKDEVLERSLKYIKGMNNLNPYLPKDYIG